MARRYLLGFDVGSSSVKASLVDADTGVCAADAFFHIKQGFSRHNFVKLNPADNCPFIMTDRNRAYLSV